MSKRVILALGLVAAVVVVVLLVSGGDSSSDGYRVRAVFDNGGFMVKGEEVRVAGANVGEIESVDVSMPGEPVAYENGKPVEKPGKAIIVMKITDPGFQDFRSDATCQIRPQSLIGEKFVDCRTTLPRAPGSRAGAAAETDRRRRGRRRPVPAAARQQRHQRRPGPDQRHPVAALRAALPADLQRTRRRPRRPRRRPRGPGQAGQPGPARRRPPLRHPLRPARPAGAAGERLRRDPRPALARARAVAGFFSNAGAAAEASAERVRNWKRRCRNSPPSSREFRKTMVEPEDLLRRGHAAVRRLRHRGAVADRRDANADAVLRSADRLAQEPRRRRRSFGPDLRRSRPGGEEGARPREVGGEADRRPGEAAGEHQEDGRLGRADRVDLQHHRVPQRVRPVRALRQIAGHADDLRRIHHRRAGLSGCVANFNGPKANAAASTDSAALLRSSQEGLEGQNGGTSVIRARPSASVRETAPRALAPEGKAGVAQSSKTEGTEPLLDYLLGP